MEHMCKRINNTIDQGDFSISNVMTVSGATGYAVDGTVRVANQSYDVTLVPGDNFSGRYSFGEGEGHMISGFAPSARPKKETLCLFEEGSKLTKKAHQNMSARVDDFIKEYANKFEALRGRSKYLPAGKVTKDLQYMLIFFETTMVIGELTDKEETRKRQNESHIDYLKRRFEDVGIEYVEDKKTKTTYIAIYRDVADKGRGMRPKFIVVTDDSKKKSVGAFVHNYNEDTKSYYLK